MQKCTHFRNVDSKLVSMCSRRKEGSNIGQPSIKILTGKDCILSVFPSSVLFILSA